MKRKLVKKKRKLVKNETKNSKTYGLYGMHGSVYAEVPPKSPKKIIIHEKKSHIPYSYGLHCKHWSTIRKLNKKIDKKDW